MTDEPDKFLASILLNLDNKWKEVLKSQYTEIKNCRLSKMEREDVLKKLHIISMVETQLETHVFNMTLDDLLERELGKKMGTINTEAQMGQKGTSIGINT